MRILGILMLMIGLISITLTLIGKPMMPFFLMDLYGPKIAWGLKGFFTIGGFVLSRAGS